MELVNFKVEIGTRLKDNKRDFTITDRETRKNNRDKNIKWYRYTCNKCGWTNGWIPENNLIKGIGCSCCCNTPRVVVEGINDIPTTAPWMVKYFQGGYDEAKLYTKASGKMIYPICPECNTIKNKPVKICDIYKKHSIGCPCKDGMSYPNKVMYNILQQLNILFKNEFSPDWIKPKRYDFYFELDNKKYIVEMDGELGHGNSNRLSGQSKEQSKAIDVYKDKLANEHDIEVIRVDAQKSEVDYIRNNMIHSQLSNILKLHDVDWKLCEQFAMNNIIKTICEFKTNNPNLTSNDIGKIFNINGRIIRTYFNKGTKFGWCNYDPIKENKLGIEKSIKTNQEKYSIPIEIFKNETSLGIYKTASEISRLSIELFGVKLHNSAISKFCSGKYKSNTYKGFKFTYR